MSIATTEKPKKKRKVKRKRRYSTHIEIDPKYKIKNSELIKTIKKFFGMDFTAEMYKLSTPTTRQEIGHTTHKNRIHDVYLDKHLEHQITLHAPRHLRVPVLIIDVDRHNKNITENQIINTIDQLVADLGVPMYIERSSVNGGYHLWYRYDGYIDHEKMHFLPNKYADDHDMIIEVVDGKKTIRFPFSYHYSELCGKYDANENDRIEILTNDEIIDYLSNEFTPPSVPSIIAYTPYSSSSEPAPKVTATRKIDSDSNTNVSTNQFNKYAYGAGTRYINQVPLALAMAWRGYEYEDYREMARTLDHGSRDMKKWSQSRIDRTLRRYWESAINKVDTDEVYVETISDDTPDDWKMRDGKFLPDREVYRQVLQVIAERELRYKRSEFVESSLKVLNAIYENIDFRKKYEYSYRNKIFGQLRGASLSKDMWEKLAKKLKVKNIRKVKKILIDYNVLNVEKDANGREYNYHKVRRAKHFLVESAQALYIQYVQPDIEKVNKAIVEIGSEIMETIPLFQQPKTVAELFEIEEKLEERLSA